MGMLSVLWNAMNNPNPHYRQPPWTVPAVQEVARESVDSVRDSIEAEAMEAILGEITPEQVVERAAEKWIASMQNPAEFESKVAAKITEKCKPSASRSKKCKKRG